MFFQNVVRHLLFLNIFFVSFDSFPSDQKIVEGEVLQIIVDDFDELSVSDKKEFLLRETATKKLLKLKENPNFPLSKFSNRRMRLKVKENNSVFEVLAAESMTASTEITVNQTILNTASTENYLSEGLSIRRSVLVILVDMIDDSAFMSRSNVEEYVFRQNNSVYSSTTFGQIQFIEDSNNDGQYDIVGPYKINYYKDDACNYYEWSNAANQLAQNDQVDTSKYNHVMYILPYNLSQCLSWAGKGQLGDINSAGPYLTWVRSDNSAPRVITHELGHNLGMHHAATDPENDGIINVEYGDYSDFMGIKLKQLNSPHLIEIGVFSSFPNQIVNANQTTETQFYLSPVEEDPLTALYPQNLIIPKINTNENYYISFRSAIHFDNSLDIAFLEGVSIHVKSNSPFSKPKLIATLSNGERFLDPENNISISQFEGGGAAGYVFVKINSTPTEIDLTPPSDPNNVIATKQVKGRNVILEWNPSTDNIGVSLYEIYRDSGNGFSKILETTSTSIADSYGKSTMTLTYQVRAKDLSGNYSNKVYSNTLIFSTTSGGGGKGGRK